jgi:hypothetical protein
LVAAATNFRIRCIGKLSGNTLCHLVIATASGQSLGHDWSSWTFAAVYCYYSGRFFDHCSADCLGDYYSYHYFYFVAISSVVLIITHISPFDYL